MRKYLGATTAQPWSGMPHKLTVRDCWVLKRMACKNNLSLVATITSKFQTASRSKHQHKKLLLGRFMTWGFSWLCSSQTSLTSPSSPPGAATGVWSTGRRLFWSWIKLICLMEKSGFSEGEKCPGLLPWIGLNYLVQTGKSFNSTADGVVLDNCLVNTCTQLAP